MFSKESIERIEKTIKLIQLVDKGVDDMNGVTLTFTPAKEGGDYRIQVDGYFTGSTISGYGPTISVAISDLRSKLVSKITDEHNSLKRKITFLQKAIDSID